MLSWRLSPFLDIRKIFRKDQITHNFYSCEKAFTRFLFHFSTTHPPPFIPTLLSNNMLGKHSSVSALSDTAVFLLRHKQRSSDVNLIISSMENISKDDSRANTMCWGSQHSSFKVPQSPLLFLPTQSKICCAEDIDTSPPPPPSYQATGELPLQGSVVTLSLMLSFGYLSQTQMPLWNITRPHPVMESASKQALLRLPEPTCLKKASRVHSTEKKRRLTGGEEIKKSCGPILVGCLQCPWKGKR